MGGLAGRLGCLGYFFCIDDFCHHSLVCFNKNRNTPLEYFVGGVVGV